MKLVIGKNSHIGVALCQHLRSFENEFSIMSTQDFLNIFLKNGQKGLSEFLEDRATIDHIYLAFGITDSKANYELATILNYKLPIALISSAQTLGIKSTSFGSVHESTTINSNYISTKKAFYKELSVGSETFSNHFHFQLHTLVPNLTPSSSWSFLGQIEKSIKFSEPFVMTSGDQLRQFHRATDVIFQVLQNKPKSEFAVIEGCTYHKLRDIAESIFSYFSLDGLLTINYKEKNPNEIYTPITHNILTIVNPSLDMSVKDIILHIESKL